LPISVGDVLVGKPSQRSILEVFVCERGSCQKPLVGLTAFRKWLAEEITRSSRLEEIRAR